MKVNDVSSNWPIFNQSNASEIALIQQICNISRDKAKKLINGICSKRSLINLRDVTCSELIQNGLSRVESERLLCGIEIGKRVYLKETYSSIITCPDDANALFQKTIAYSFTEKVSILILNLKNAVITQEIISEGNHEECIIDPKVIFEKVLRNKGTRFILAHNHPSGSLDESEADVDITKSIYSASKVMNIEFIDHLIVIGEGFKSIKEYHPEIWE